MHNVNSHTPKPHMHRGASFTFTQEKKLEWPVIQPVKFGHGNTMWLVGGYHARFVFRTQNDQNLCVFFMVHNESYYLQPLAPKY